MALTKISTAMISQSAAAVDLNVDAGTFYVDTTNNRVGVGGKTDPDTPLHVIGTVTATTFAGSGASLTNIPNSALTNSSITINSNAVSLGGSLTLTTANIAENTNLYYTDARADARIAAADTGDLSEGSNLYFTNARADARITAALIDEDDMSSNSATRIPSQQSVKAYVDTEVAGIVDSAPGALNTLNELAAALGDDSNFSTTVSNSIAAKASLSGATFTGNVTVPNLSVTSTNWLGFGDYGERISGSNASSTLDFYTDATLALRFNSTQDATFYGDITLSGASSPKITITDTTQTTSLLMYSQDGDSIVGTYTSHPLKLFSNSAVALTLDTSQNAQFAGNLDVTGTITGDDGLSIQGGTGNAYLQVGSDTGSWTWKNYRSNHKLALEDSDGTGEVLNFDTSGNANFAGNIAVGNSSTAKYLRAYYNDGSYMTLEGYGLEMSRNSSYIRPNTDGDKTLYIGGADASLDWSAIHFRSTNGLALGGTNFIDGSLNLQNIATISAGNSSLGSGSDISMSSGSAGQVRILGNGYQGAIALDSNAMHIYHNSSSRDLVFGTDETARLNISGTGLFDFQSNNLQGITALTVNTGGLRVYGGGSFSDVGQQMHLHTDSGGFGRLAVHDLRILTGSNNGRTEKFRIDSSGNILMQNGSPEFHFGTTSASHYNWRIAVQEVLDGGFEIATGTQSAGGSALGDTYTTRLTINSSGNVGIANGGTAAANKLQIGSMGSTGYGGNYVAVGDGTRVYAIYPNSSADTIDFYTNKNYYLRGSGNAANGANLHLEKGLYVGSDAASNSVLASTQVYIKRRDGSHNLQRWGEGDVDNQNSYRFRIDQNYKFIGNSGSGDNIILDSSNGRISGVTTLTVDNIINDSYQSDTAIGFLTTGNAAQDIRTKSLFAGTSYGDTPPAGSINITNTYEHNGTTLIDNNKSLQNISSINITGASNYGMTITSTGGANYVQGGIILKTGTSDTPSVRASGIHIFNEGSDNNFWAGTFYNSTSVYGVSYKSSTSFDAETANVANYKWYVDTNGNTAQKGYNLADGGYRVGQYDRWKIRGNSGHAQLAFEYSTSSGLSDSNIKVELDNTGGAAFGARISTRLSGYGFDVRKSSVTFGDGGTNGVFNGYATSNYYFKLNGADYITLNSDKIIYKNTPIVHTGTTAYKVYAVSNYGSAQYMHLKTGTDWGNETQMYALHFTGHEYNGSKIIDAGLAFYNYSPSGSGVVNIGSTGTHTSTVYESSDGKIVIRITLDTYYCHIIVNQFNTAQGLEMLSISAAAANSSATHYA